MNFKQQSSGMGRLELKLDYSGKQALIELQRAKNIEVC